MQLKKIYFILCIICGLALPIYAKDNSFKEIQKAKYGADRLHTYLHTASGLEVIWIENQDVNKSFILGVKTPTYDSTGVNHIIEHTLFTGSMDYPSSSLFFDASEAYPNTYMNALTTGDMTIFPFSTPYKACYKKLLHVYLDAIFKPNMVNEPYGFYEEAFYIDADQNRVAGVVYNEMKGAYGSNERIVFRTLRNMIFEKSHYAHDSGGSPNEIPTLTYEKCIQTYKSNYYPANMKIILYGDIEIKESLQEIACYLEDTNIYKDAPKESIELNVKEISPNTTGIYKVLPNTRSGYLVKSFVIKEPLSGEKIQALDLWMTAYLMNTQAGFQKQLLYYGLGQAKWIKDDDLPYPVYSLVISDLPCDKLEYYSKIVDGLLAQIPKEMVRNHFAEKDILAEARWLMLKKDTSIARGIEIGESILDGWAHHRELSQYYTKMNYIQDAKTLDSSAYNILLGEAQRYTAMLLPGEYHLEEPEKLTQLSKEEWTNVLPKMHKWQQQKINLEPITLEQLIQKPTIKLQTKKHKYYTEMVSHIDGQWARSQLYIGTGHISQKDLPYLFLYAHLLEESAKEITPFSGMISASCTAYSKGEAYWPCIKISVLTRKNEEEHSVLLEQARSHLLNKPDEWYRQKLGEWTLDMKYTSRNNVLGTLSRLSFGSKEGEKRYLYEQGYPIYSFCEELLDLKHCFWKMKIKEMDEYLYHKGDLVLATTVPTRKQNPYQESWRAFIEKLPSMENEEVTYQFKAYPKTSLLKGQDAVDYSYMSFHKEGGLDGLDYLATAYLTKNYLYPRIRVELGAYGTGCQLHYPNTIAFYTYRDPNYMRSLEIMEGACDYLSQPINEKSFLRSKAEALSRLHSQFHLLDVPLEYTNTLESLALMGQNPEKIMALQQQILNASPEAIAVKGKIYKQLLKEGSLAIMTQKKYTKEQEYISYSY